MRILVAGRTGQLARNLLEAAPESVIAVGRESFDFTVPRAAARCVAESAPDIVVNAAAWTNVDGAESQESAAYLLNAKAAGELADAAAARDVPFIHISTDYVFDGTKTTAYVETDPVGPINAYGRTKLAGERAVMEAHPSALVLRTSWVYDHAGKNFPLTILSRARSLPRLSVVDDQFGCPTYAPDLAAAILSMAGRLRQPGAPAGIFHAAGTTETTWHGFASAIVTAAGLETPVDPVPASTYSTLAARPRNSRLDCHRLLETFGLALPGWQDAVPRFMAALKSSTSQMKKDA